MGWIRDAIKEEYLRKVLHDGNARPWELNKANDEIIGNQLPKPWQVYTEKKAAMEEDRIKRRRETYGILDEEDGEKELVNDENERRVYHYPWTKLVNDENERDMNQRQVKKQLARLEKIHPWTNAVKEYEQNLRKYRMMIKPRPPWDYVVEKQEVKDVKPWELHDGTDRDPVYVEDFEDIEDSEALSTKQNAFEAKAMETRNKSVFPE